MTQWKLTLAYNGTGFHGWQVQPGLHTVQGTLAAALLRLTGEQVLPQGAGRTDTGVHALGQVASFALQAPLPAANLQRALNRILPAGVRVLQAEVVPDTFHARHSARGKFYEYRIFERRRRETVASRAQPGTSPGVSERICSPFLAPFVWDCRWPLDVEPMQEAAQHLLGTHDFTAMGASARSVAEAPVLHEDTDRPRNSQPNPVKTLHAADWTHEGDLLLFRVRGSGFLHHMVRNLVGTLADVGRGSLRPDDIPRILASGDRALAGPTAPASGLYLVEVHYPAEVQTPAHEPVAASGVSL